MSVSIHAHNHDGDFTLSVSSRNNATWIDFDNVDGGNEITIFVSKGQLVDLQHAIENFFIACCKSTEL